MRYARPTMHTTPNPSTPEIDALAAAVRTQKAAVDRAKREYYAGLISYDELAAVGRAFCAAFDRYHRAKYGKGKRLDYRAVIR